MDNRGRSRLGFRVASAAAGLACSALVLAGMPVAAGASNPRAVTPTTTPKGPPVPGAPKCQMFPGDNVWNTDISTLPVN
ncbi:MAG: hypothetical protein ABSD97_02450, partial [Acidimicrobiales bacterium]